jgi:hypothetical protein
VVASGGIATSSSTGCSHAALAVIPIGNGQWCPNVSFGFVGPGFLDSLGALWGMWDDCPLCVYVKTYLRSHLWLWVVFTIFRAFLDHFTSYAASTY